MGFLCKVVVMQMRILVFLLLCTLLLTEEMTPYPLTQSIAEMKEWLVQMISKYLLFFYNRYQMGKLAFQNCYPSQRQA